MKTTRYIPICALAILLGHPAGGSAEDIDIYSGLSGSAYTPNVLIVMDNGANFSADAPGSCSLTNASGVPATNTLSGTTGGIEQCALHKVIESLPVNSDATGSARVKVGFMVYNGSNIHDIKYAADGNSNCNGSTGGCLVYPLTEMTAAGKAALKNWITTWQTSNGGSGSFWIKAAGDATAATTQEAWAYYAGKTGLSGRNYETIKPSSGCQKNFVIYIGNAYAPSSTPGDASSGNPEAALTPAIGGLTKPSGMSDAEWAALKTSWKAPILNTVETACGSPYDFKTPSSNHSENGGHFADEWARFMNQADLYSATNEPANTQSIITYTVGLLGESCKPEYAALLKNMADYGGGKYFPTTDYDTLVSSIMQVLNEIQAVNSVFASSSLPVSVNAQGTYLNQIYMGMFRPDAKAQPRWVGNLKQFAFTLDADNKLQLSDSVGRPALDSAGTGFVSANAISYWTCSRSDNPYLTDTTKTSTAEKDTLTNQGQICETDPAGGFWANAPGMNNTAGKEYDLADGELVEKGGAAQRMRLANLTNSYTTDSTTNTRKLYTFCPKGTEASCKTMLTDANNAFAATNSDVANAGFGGSSSVNIASLTRSGDTVTATTASNHGFATGDSILVANALPGAYNGNKTITKISATQFSYPITTDPPTPATTTTGGYTVLAATPRTVTRLARAAGSLTITATSTGHGFVNGDTVNISGASETTPGSGETQFNKASAVVTRVDADTFTYTVPAIVEVPSVNASGGTATRSSTTHTIGSVTRASEPDTTKCGGRSPCWKVTVNTVDAGGNPVAHGFLDTNTVRLDGITDSGGATSKYNKAGAGRRIYTTVGSTAFTFYYPFFTTDTSVGPTEATTGIVASPLVGAPLPITILTRSGGTATATTFSSHGFANGAQAVISATAPGAGESAYLGTFTVSNVTPSTFDYTVPTTPATPATVIGGATSMTATGGAPDSTDLINWVRGHDNNGDETGPTDPASPAAPITVRPSLHGDVLHSRPTVLNYGGQGFNVTATDADPSDATMRLATAAAADITKYIGAVGAMADIRFANGQTCGVTVTEANKFRYRASNCGAIGGQTVATTTSNTIVFYGDNGGVFHAVNGNQVNPKGGTLPAPGNELWGFIPREMFEKLNRLRTNNPQLELSTTPGGILPDPKPKDYFVDGPVGVYQVISENGTTTEAILYLTMRRGGRVIYALDVTDPVAPKLKWKIDNNLLWKADSSGNFTTVASGLGELGQTWSQPKVAKVANSGRINKWVLIFGAGYATEEDDDPPVTADTMGRGIFVLDAFTGELIWKATYGASDGCSGTTAQASCTVSGMKYSIPSDITLLDRDLDRYGYIDRLYVGDTGGNVWRVDIEPDGANSTPDKWRIYKLAALGCGSGACSIPPGDEAQRKIFYPPEVITTKDYDAVIVGTGDREHPLYVHPNDIKTNRAVLLKDTKVGKSVDSMTAITNDDLDDKTHANCLSGKGYKYTFDKGEKVVNAPLVTAGSVYFGTNKPSAPEANSCTSTLGTAKGYKLEPFTCSAPTSVEFAGGGLPPTPVSGVVNIVVDGIVRQVPFLIGGGDQSGSGSLSSALEGQKPTINVPTTRTRTYWYRDGR